jgi:hypothetical protein
LKEQKWGSAIRKSKEGVQFTGVENKNIDLSFAIIHIESRKPIFFTCNHQTIGKFPTANHAAVLLKMH